MRDEPLSDIVAPGGMHSDSIEFNVHHKIKSTSFCRSALAGVVESRSRSCPEIPIMET